MLSPGQLIDNRYKILRVLGRGGTSCVYLAENIRLHNYWAIKEVNKEIMTVNGIPESALVAESHILTKLRHPGLPAIVDIMSTPTSYLLVMEYIEGESLDTCLASRGRASQREVVKWGCQLCDVLGYLHSRSPAIIYRDMKPANVMLKPDGDVVLIDFGMAREFKRYSTHDTTNLGTHGYAAPEQYRGQQQTDARTDIYCLGVTLYHLATGHDPCVPPYGIHPIRSIDPNLSPVLEQIINKCTKIDPNERYQSVEALKADLMRVDLSYRPTVPESGYSQAVPYNSTPAEEKSNSGLLWLLALVPLAIIAVIVAVVLATSDSGKSGGDILGPEESVSKYYYKVDVEITYPDERIQFTFTPEESGYYHIYSKSTEEDSPIVWIMDSSGEVVAQDNDKGTLEDFFVRCWMEAGEEYAIQTTLYDLNPDLPATGTFELILEG